jgi:hypothetical protein
MQRRGSSNGQSVKGQRQRTKSEARKVPTARASSAARDDLLADERSDRLDDQNKTVASNNFNAGPWLQRCFRARTPDLSLDANTSLLSIP